MTKIQFLPALIQMNLTIARRYVLVNFLLMKCILIFVCVYFPYCETLKKKCTTTVGNITLSSRRRKKYFLSLTFYSEDKISADTRFCDSIRCEALVGPRVILCQVRNGQFLPPRGNLIAIWKIGIVLCPVDVRGRTGNESGIIVSFVC